MPSPLSTNLVHIQDRIRKAALGCQRDPAEIQMIAVCKTQPVDQVRAAIAAGCTLVGENYIQEARQKFDALAAHTSVEWHFIGHLQRNKAKYAVRIFDLIQTVDSMRLARAIDKECAKIGKQQRILIQVNIGEEGSKSGALADEALDLIGNVAQLNHLKVQGLMAIPPFYNDPQGARPYFKGLRLLRDAIATLKIPRIEMHTLSMGMTGDFETAIEEGATLVRIGTALFGPRT